MSKTKAKQKARKLLVQALYSWDLGGTDLETIEINFHSENDMSKVDTELFKTILFGAPQNLEQIDGAFQKYLDREQEKLDPVSRAILRLTTYELMFSIEVPYRVAINEGVNLAKTFGPTDAFKFINGVLDRVAADTRAVEIAAHKG
ncbi:transcription antitermination factor NusB [Porticoccaceae bacterium]|jgi:N utilization substance protein B|nr:transcription antitermination factor NusB [Porticoccaceae bacterium]MDA8898463.1 transcription antitermination factor NusB [Porticoccaceae bacterium]MDB3925536.1 transcription antitermination factor NusB [Porticoccaceae bacterium]